MNDCFHNLATGPAKLEFTDVKGFKGDSKAT